MPKSPTLRVSSTKRTPSKTTKTRVLYLKTTDAVHILRTESEINDLCQRLLEGVIMIDEQASSEADLESYYQKLVELRTDGSHLATEHGITDVSTPYVHIEIKGWSKYKHALGQLLAYDVAEPRESKHVYFFGEKPPQHKIDSIISLFKKFDISVYHFEGDVLYHTLTAIYTVRLPAFITKLDIINELPL